MFKWYKLYSVCFAYLSDLLASIIDELSILWRDVEKRLACRWFWRDWILLELLAFVNLEFYDDEWNLRGFKIDAGVMRRLFAMTGICNSNVDQDSDAIREVVVGEIISWAFKRQTKRVEDLPYCLLGIF